MLECIETLHSKHIIHRDLKPENFMVGIGSDCNRVHVIDFGLSKVFRDNNNEHIPYRENKVLFGSVLTTKLKLIFSPSLEQLDMLQ